MQPPCGLSQRRGRESVITEEEIYTPQFLTMQIGSSILGNIFRNISVFQSRCHIKLWQFGRILYQPWQLDVRIFSFPGKVYYFHFKGQGPGKAEGVFPSSNPSRVACRPQPHYSECSNAPMKTMTLQHTLLKCSHKCGPLKLDISNEIFLFYLKHNSDFSNVWMKSMTL